ncbi:MAG: hypothetical protein NTZ07_00820 [Candidatus Woesebacteria bacterium]|nr:hypothetical protein [Candidatus Woesebacteria bacterium]
MPKITGPLFSLSASGKIGEGIAYSTGRNGSNVKQRYKTKSKNSPSQLVSRLWWQKGYYVFRNTLSGYGYFISSYCNGLNQDQRDIWERHGIGQSLGPINYFLKLWLKKSGRGEAQIQLPPATGFCVAAEWCAKDLIAGGKFILGG